MLNNKKMNINKIAEKYQKINYQLVLGNNLKDIKNLPQLEYQKKNKADVLKRIYIN